MSGALIQSESCLVQVGSLWDSNPEKPQQHSSQGGSWESHLKHKSWLLWKRTPVEAPLCTLFYIYIYFFFVRMGVKELEMCPTFSGSRQKVVIQYAKDFL